MTSLALSFMLILAGCGDGSDPTSPPALTAVATAVTASASDNAVILALASGKFKANLTKSDFEFSVADSSNEGQAAELAKFTAADVVYAQIDDTTASISNLGSLAGNIEVTITIKGSAQSVQIRKDADITAVAEQIVTSAASANFNAGGKTLITITLTDGIFKKGAITADDFTFGGTDAAALGALTDDKFTRVSNTVVTIAISGLSGGDDTVLVKKAALVKKETAVALDVTLE
jgi:hypothetical protein